MYMTVYVGQYKCIIFLTDGLLTYIFRNNKQFSIPNYMYTRGRPRAFRQGKVLRHFQDFREKFLSKFLISLYVLYI